MRVNFNRVLAFALIVVLSATTAVGARAQGNAGYEIVDETYVEIEGMRPIGLSPNGQYLAAFDLGEGRLCTLSTPDLSEVACTSIEPLEAGLRVSDVRWSPDSTRLALAENAFIYFKDGDLWVMDAESGDLINIADDHHAGGLFIEEDGTQNVITIDVNPAWTPDGRGITVSRSAMVGGESIGNDIVTLPAEGGEPVSLLEVSLERPGLAFYGMEWSRDGRYLYYSVLDPSDSPDLVSGVYQYDVETERTELIAGESDDQGAAALVQVGASGRYVLLWYSVALLRLDTATAPYAVYDTVTGELRSLVSP